MECYIPGDLKKDFSTVGEIYWFKHVVIHYIELKYSVIVTINE